MVKLGSAFSDNLVQSIHIRSRGGDVESPWWAGAGRALVFATILCVGFFLLGWRLFDLTVIHGLEYRKSSDSNRTRILTRHAPRGIVFDRTGMPLVVNVPVRTQFGAEYIRQYPYEEALSHVLGYIGELSERELMSDYYKNRNYVLGDRVGRMGVEEALNEKLRGRDGREYVEVDAMGNIVRSLGRQEELQGEDITLSLDLGIAKAAAAAFPPGEKGAIIVSKPKTGEILALYSSPVFSPNDIVSALQDSDLPMFNRAIGGVYPPGSTFKIVMGIAGLETGAITKSTIVEDNGSITIGPFTFPNWYFLQYGKTEGPVDIIKALKRSNDIYFYKVGEALGITKIVSWARTLGIGKPLGIEISGEASGLVPDPEWKDARFHTPGDLEARNNLWYLGDTYHISIGQGYLLTTPLAVNSWTNVVANGGKLCRPTIQKLKSLKDQRDICKELKIKPETIATVTLGMEEACKEGGTGWPLFNFQVSVACKTGTAEFGDPKNRTHAWFTAFAPIEDPEISVTVLVEGAGEGSNVAAPVAKKIFEEWFGR